MQLRSWDFAYGLDRFGGLLGGLVYRPWACPLGLIPSLAPHFHGQNTWENLIVNLIINHLRDTWRRCSPFLSLRVLDNAGC